MTSFCTSGSGPTELCSAVDDRGLHIENNGSWWLGEPLEITEAQQRYPQRPCLDWASMPSAARTRAATQAARDIAERIPQDSAFFLPSVAHFHGIRMEEAEEDADPNGNDDDGEAPLFDVRVGDFVLVNNDHYDSKAQVEELYQAADGSRRMRLHWFYDAKETELGVKGADGAINFGGLEIDERRLWRAKDRDNATYITDYDVGTISRRIDVIKVGPGMPIPADARTYWYSQEVDRRFMTFEAPQADEPPNRALWASKRRVLYKMDVFAGAGGLAYMGEQELAGGRVRVVNQWAVDFEEDMAATFRANFPETHVVQSGTDEWLALCQDVHALYSSLPENLKRIVDGKASPKEQQDAGVGIGGMSAHDSHDLIYPSRSLVMEQRAKQRSKRGQNNTKATEGAAGLNNDGVHLQYRGRKEPVEADYGAAVAGPSNKPAHGTQQFGSKTGKATRNGVSSSSFEVEHILGVRLAEKAPRATKGISKDHLLDFIAPSDRWLEFLVRWKGYGQEDDTWEPESNLQGCLNVLAAFVRRLRVNKLIPFPGEVDLLVGGPPCQGVSGNNRHALAKDILCDPRNRQLLVFLAMASWWRPAYVLMENVQDILKKESGAYVKFALGKMVSEGYQARLALIAAGQFGCAQGRWRVFLWAARANEQLPAFPEPTHHCRDFMCHIAGYGKSLVVGFLNEENALRAHPPVLLGDVLGDLPSVTNFEVADRNEWAAPPLTIPQAWLRRSPPTHSAPLGQRLRHYDEYNGGGRQLNALMRTVGYTKGLEALGMFWMNFKDPTTPLAGGKRRRADGILAGSFAYETTMAALKELIPDEKTRDVFMLQVQASRKSYAHTTGEHVAESLERYFNITPAEWEARRLTDHRPLPCNTDDYLRMAGVPPRLHVSDESSFRDLEGVVVHAPSRAACAGHTHHPRLDGKSMCPAGGTHDAAAKHHRGKSQGRVDHSEREGWRGAATPGCPSFTALMPTGDLLCPRWCVTFKSGFSSGRTTCFGRVHPTEVLPTVVGRAEPHNLRIVHPSQHRVLSIREMARCQGFPDYHVFCGKAVFQGRGRWVRNPGIKQRYQQVGNAVSPAVAAALGRCLALAAIGESLVGEPVISIPDPQYERMVEELRADGMMFYYETVPDEERESCIPVKVFMVGGTASGQEESVDEGGDGEDEEEIDEVDVEMDEGDD